VQVNCSRTTTQLRSGGYPSAAYQQFKTEAQLVKADYQPTTVNTAGWQATQLAWRQLFAHVTLIGCFRHAFLKIGDRCKHMPVGLGARSVRLRYAHARLGPDRSTEARTRCCVLGLVGGLAGRNSHGPVGLLLNRHQTCGSEIPLL